MIKPTFSTYIFTFLPIFQITICDAFSAVEPRININDGDPSSDSLFYKEHEAATTNQAYSEEKLLMASSASRDELTMISEHERINTIEWVNDCLKVEARARSTEERPTAGFGGGKPKSKLFNPARDPNGYGATIQKFGVARIDSVLSPETSALLTQFVDEEKLLCEREIADGHVSEISRFSRVLLKKNRHDLLLQLEGSDIVMQALYEILGDNSKKLNKDFPVMNVIDSTLGPDAELYELACLISDPGSDRQVIHPDIAFQGESQIRTGPLITCFVALQNIDNQMGPTEFLPQTNTKYFHDRLDDVDIKNEMLSIVPSKLSSLNQGDCSIFDATILHAGSANRSNSRRRLFYFTFRSLAMDDPRTSNNPGSIRPELKKKKLSLKDIHKRIRSWKKRKKKELKV